jgi:hypothetical protein
LCREMQLHQLLASQQQQQQQNEPSHQGRAAGCAVQVAGAAWGGTCLNVACLASKVSTHNADRACCWLAVRHAQLF